MRHSCSFSVWLCIHYLSSLQWLLTMSFQDVSGEAEASRFQCPHCECVVQSRDDFEVHLVTMHDAEPSFVCNECGMAFLLQAMLGTFIQPRSFPTLCVVLLATRDFAAYQVRSPVETCCTRCGIQCWMRQNLASCQCARLLCGIVARIWATTAGRPLQHSLGNLQPPIPLTSWVSSKMPHSNHYIRQLTWRENCLFTIGWTFHLALQPRIFAVSMKHVISILSLLSKFTESPGFTNVFITFAFVFWFSNFSRVMNFSVWWFKFDVFFGAWIRAVSSLTKFRPCWHVPLAIRFVLLTLSHGVRSRNSRDIYHMLSILIAFAIYVLSFASVRSRTYSIWTWSAETFSVWDLQCYFWSKRCMEETCSNGAWGPTKIWMRIWRLLAFVRPEIRFKTPHAERSPETVRIFGHVVMAPFPHAFENIQMYFLRATIR